MAVFFNGRQWITPATMSVVDDSAMFNRNVAVGNRLAIVGSAGGGKPHSELVFGSPAEAAAVLRNDLAIKAVERAFDPSAQTGGPAEVVFVRVDPATQSELTLKDDTSADVILLKSTDYGAATNQIKVKIEDGTDVGKRITTQLGNSYYSADNIARNALSVGYTGSGAAATISVASQAVTLEVDSAQLVIDLNIYDTVQKLVDRINAEEGFAAEVLDGNGNRPTVNALDHVAGQALSGAAYVVTANLQAIVDWFNGQSEGFVTAERVAGAGAVPANIGFTYLSGGADGIATNQDWAKAFELLQGVDVQWVVPLSGDASIHAMADSHCAFMSTVGRMERRAICGTDLDTGDDDAIDAAKALNSDRTSLTHIGVYDYDQSGSLKLYPPYIAAVAVAGGFAGSNPGTAMTNKALKVRGLERKLRNPTDTDRLIQGGVLCIEDTPSGFKVVKSISTWLNDENFNRVEVSTGVALDFTARSVRTAVDALRGERGNPITMQRALNIAESTLRELSRPEPSGPGVLVGDEENPPYRGLSVSMEGDVLRIEFQCSPVIPVNYIPVTIYAVPYSGSASA